jgi:hypothetical protein
MRVIPISLVLAFVPFGLVKGAEPAASDAAESSPSTRYGPFGLLDHRSIYGQYWFVEPLRGPEMDVDREVRVDYFHSESHGSQLDSVKGEIEYNFNLLTVEVELPWERDSNAMFNRSVGRTIRHASANVGNLELAARHPLFQFVSADNFFDYTVAGAFELGIPTNSPISKDTEFVPKLFQLARLGDHLSVEASAGLSMFAGPQLGGEDTLEYNLVLGYNVEHEELPLPHVLRTIPIFELNGDSSLHGPDSGTNRLSGTAGFRLNFDSIGPAQPRIGIGYVFPIDKGARDRSRWGIVTSLVFEY